MMYANEQWPRLNPVACDKNPWPTNFMLEGKLTSSQRTSKPRASLLDEELQVELLVVRVESIPWTDDSRAESEPRDEPLRATGSKSR